MPIITGVEARAGKTRLLYAVIYASLIAGSLSMLYPFCLMLSISIKTRLDQDEFDVIPAYLYDDRVLYRKYLESKYNGSPSRMQAAYRLDPDQKFEFQDMPVPTPVNEQRLRDYQEFSRDAQLPLHFMNLGHIRSGGTELKLFRSYKNALRRRFHGDLRRFNREMNQELGSWAALPQPDQLDGGGYWRNRDEMGRPLRPILQAFVDFEARQSRADMWPAEMHYYFVATLMRRYGLTIEDYNAAHGTRYASWKEVPFPNRRPADPKQAADWMRYVHELLPPQYLRDDGTLDGPVWRWQEYLQAKYRSTAALNRAWGTAYASFEQVTLPQAEQDWVDLQRNRWSWRWDFLTRNYAIVLDYLFLQGRAMWVTLGFIALSILTALTFNPLAAYALSRFQLPSTYQILLFCMATMAFPAEVTMIPGFLLLRDLSLLNTLWALVLPGAASGFSIFLLKGFFDALPRELYESAIIDGASELRMFWQVTLPLSKPILAVIALGAFTGAYGSFMFAFVTNQNPDWWTIMVFLYQFQQQMTRPVVFAALVLVSIPTLLVFVLCQNVILRGIIIPVEK